MMMPPLSMSMKIAACATVVLLLGSGFAFADDWTAVKLRGNVFTYNGSGWDRLNRGDAVSDDRVIRTLRSGRVQFRREAETIEIGGATQISIHDRTGQRYTTVKEDYGTVEVEADHKNVKHFSVLTPYLAAVVKGTRFKVTSDAAGARVEVTRGLVEVRDLARDVKVNVHPGQRATAGTSVLLNVKGEGELSPIETLDGQPFDPHATAGSGGNGSASGGLIGMLFGGGDGTSGSGGTADTVVSGASTALNTTTSAVTDTLSDTVGSVTGSGGAVGETVSGVVDDVADTVDETVENTTSAVGNLVGGLLGG